MADISEQITQLQTDLGKLDRAIASGVLTVDSHTQGRVTYRDMQAMFRAREFLQTRLDRLQNVVFTRRIVVTGRSGF